MADSRRSSGLGAVAAATAAVFVAGQRAGSAVLADERCLLTAGHVLARAGASPGAPDHVIEVEFPFAPVGGAGVRVPARQVTLDAAAADVGVLDLVPDGDLPGWLPAAVPLWPARRLPGRVSVLGFPREEKALRGVWRDFDIAGPAADGTVQLDWAGEAGTLPGHSGGPVVDPATGALVGVLVQGSQAGRFDRFVPVTVIGWCCPGLPFPWLMAGTDARGHFMRRSRGQRSHSRGGDLFRGRAAALAAVGGWLTDADDQGRPLVVTGQPGAGKSAVLARAVIELEAARVGPGLAFHARNATHDDLLAAVADLTGAEHAGTRDELLEALDDRPPAGLVMIAVDALDEAASAPDRTKIAGTLAELAVVPHVRVAVATRPLSAGNRYHVGGLLPALGIGSAESPALVDLDTDRYFEPTGLRQFAAAVLTQHQARHPGPAGAAWTTYRADPALRDRLADVIAARAARNYLVAAMAAVPLSAAEQPEDPAADGFDPARIPSGVGEALGKYLEQMPEPQQSRTRALLAALAYARGDGIDDRTWTAFTSALGYPVGTPDLDQLRASTAADYLLQAIPDDSGPVTRLFHQALVDELLANRHQPSDERALLSALRPAPDATWATASRYALTHAADHASRARQLLGLLNDPDYLAYADLARLPALLMLDADTATDPVAVIVCQVAARANPLPPARRARLLALAAAHFGLPDLRRRLAASGNQPFTPIWAHPLGIPHTEFTAHVGVVHAVATGRTGDRELIVLGGGDGTVRVWDAVTGQALYAPLTGHTEAVRTVAIGRIGQRDVIVSGSEDQTVHVWDAATGHPLGEPLTGHTGTVWRVAIGRIGERDVIVSGGQDATIRVWDASTYRTVDEPLFRHSYGAVESVAIGRIGGCDVIVSGGGDNSVRVWDAAAGQPLYGPLTGHTNLVQAVALGRIGGRDVIVSGSWDNTVRVWDAAVGQLLYGPLTGHTDFVEAVALGRIGGREVIVSGSSDNTIRLWDAATGRSVGEPLTGHSRSVRAVTVARIGERDVIVSGGWDDTVRVWDAAQGQFTGEPRATHTGSVHMVTSGLIGGREVIVSGSSDNTVRLWDAATGRPIGDPLTGHTDDVYAVALGHAGDDHVIVSGGGDDTVRLWEAATGKSRGKPISGHGGAAFAVAIARIGTRDVIAVGGLADEVQVRDAVTCRPIYKPITGHTAFVAAVAMGRVGERDVIVSGGQDTTVRVWDANTGVPLYGPMTGHTGQVTEVAIGRAAGHDIIVSSGTDNSVRMWDAVRGQPLGEPLADHSDHVTAVAIGRIGQRDVIVSGSWDNTVRIWDITQGESLVIDLLGAVTSVTLTCDGLGVCIGTGHTISLFRETGTV